MCDGSVYAASDWPDLAAVMGASFLDQTLQTLTLPDLVSHGRFPRGGTADEIGVTEDAAVNTSGLSIEIEDPGHHHATVFEGNYGTKQSYRYRNDEGELEWRNVFPVFEDAFNEDSTTVRAAAATLVEAGVSATLAGSATETRPVSIKLLPAIYAGRAG